jgi:hypothetical protein
MAAARSLTLALLSADPSDDLRSNLYVAKTIYTR